MSVDSVIKEFADKNLDYKIILSKESTHTVYEAAAALSVEPASIAKTIGLALKDDYILLLTEGTARIDNRKFKDEFACKAKMIPFDMVEDITGHPPGGVCPFGLIKSLPVYLDISLEKHKIIYPAAGSPNSAVEMTPSELRLITDAKWVDVCK